jgi:hypothetical protein
MLMPQVAEGLFYIRQENGMGARNTTSSLVVEVIPTMQNIRSMCTRHVICSAHPRIDLGLKVKIPMILEMDNKGAVDLANNWSIGGCTRHVDIRQCFLWELKESKLLTSIGSRVWITTQMRSPRPRT